MAFRRVRPVLLATAAVALLAFSACSASSPGPRPSTPANLASAPSSSITSAGGSASGHPADKATVAAVTKAYAVFFSPKSSLAASLQALQHGPLFTAAINAQSKSSQAQHASARVTKVTLLSPHVAAVRFDILSSGHVLLPDSEGNAVLENGRWKVAAKTFCDLLALTNQAPPPCSNPSVTRLPG